MHFQRLSTSNRHWWRRKKFYFRQISFQCWIYIFLIILFLILILPNPFDSRYQSLSLHQNVEWINILDVLKLKEEILRNDTSAKFISQGTDEPAFSSTILIVLYTNIFREKKFCSLSNDQIFGRLCPSHNRCQWSCDATQYRQADALIFHAYDIPLNRFPMPDRSQTKRNSVWILWSDEPPSIIDYSLFNSYQFNWTISYKLNSEVSLATYGLVSQRNAPLPDNDYEQWIDTEFARRKFGALWFVSNCHAKKRLNIFHQLKSVSNLLIEGYGRCVDYYPLHLCGSYSQCERDYMSKFLFYLSFESNTCQDYITEKFYKAFYYGLIPIVYGPEKSNYERLAPKNSFLYLNDYPSDLVQFADYLEKISSSRTLFSYYHQWRQTSEVILDGRALEPIRMCELCQRLINLRQGAVIYYKNLKDFYNDKCSSI